MATPSNYAWIDKAEKTGDLTVRIKMKKPTPAALEYLAMVTPIHPKAYREKVGPEGFAAKPVGAGPYKIVKNEQGKEVVFERFDDYWAGSPKGKPAIKTLHVRFVPDVTTDGDRAAGASAPTGSGTSIPTSSPTINKMPHLQATQQESMRIGYLSIDAAGRSGSGQSADQPEGAPGDLARHQPPGHGRQAGAGRQPRAAWRRASRRQFGCDADAAVKYAYDPAKAKALLAEAGFPNGFDIELVTYVAADLVDGGDPELPAGGRHPRQDHPAAGGGRRSRRRGRARTPLYHGSWGSYSINDVSAIFPVMYGGGNDDYARDPELEKLVADGGATSDPAARKKAYSAAIKIMTEKAYWLPLFTYVNAYAFSKQLDFKTYPRRAAALLLRQVAVGDQRAGERRASRRCSRTPSRCR